jgi:threonine/homoserine/homoserine lactone efflux protein
MSLAAYFLQGLLLGLSAALMPGPFMAFLLAQALRQGWRRTLPAALAPLISDGPIVVMALFALTQAPPWLLKLLQIAGGLFLLYLALRATVPFAPPSEAGRQNLLKAALMNALSPGPYIFWSTVAGPIVLAGWRESPVAGGSFMVGFYAALIGSFAGFTILCAIAGQLDPRLSQFLTGLSVLLLLLFGLYQIWAGVTTI